jgi:hypothetical protein
MCSVSNRLAENGIPYLADRASTGMAAGLAAVPST